MRCREDRVAVGEKALDLLGDRQVAITELQHDAAGLFNRGKLVRPVSDALVLGDERSPVLYAEPDPFRVRNSLRIIGKVVADLVHEPSGGAEARRDGASETAV